MNFYSILAEGSTVPLEDYSANVSLPQKQECAKGPEAADSIQKDGEFVWPKATQGLILGAFFWGYFTTQVFNIFFFIGFLNENFGKFLQIFRIFFKFLGFSPNFSDFLQI